MNIYSRWGSIMALVLAGSWGPAALAAEAAKDPSPTTRALNRSALATLPMADQGPFNDAQRGLIEAATDQVITGASGNPVWTLKGYEFLNRDEAPDSVNPALWMHARLNLTNGLFKVAERVYQVRGFDLSNMTILEGDTGLIVIDPLVSVETARAALAMYYKHRPNKPVVAVIYSHSHVDHFGGVRGVVNGDDVAAGKVRIIAPAGFMEEAVGENVIAGNAMSRRAMYQFGLSLPRSEKGSVDAGLGKTSGQGTISLIAPTQIIAKPREAHRIDGVDIVFELTPGAEAPAEMIMYYPQFRVLNMTEIATQNMHNLLPMRGALVRDALAWSKYLGGALVRYGDKSEVLIAQHNWPTWGTERVVTMLKHQRDTYKYLHDQTVHLMNQGYSAGDIAETLSLPPSLMQDWASHPFYGHLKTNVRAIYQRYLGHYDGNPASLEALPPVATAKKTVEYMGGADAVLKRAQDDFAQGNYRWVAQVLSQVVFADPSNAAARSLAADAYEQLGYQMESATARNALLLGAKELRNGPPKLGSFASAAPDVIRALPLDMFFDYLGVRLNGDKALGKTIVLNWHFTDTHQDYILNLENSALTYVADAQSATADASISLSRDTLNEISLQQTTFPKALLTGKISISGNPAKAVELLGLLDTFSPGFALVEPRPGQ